MNDSLRYRILDDIRRLAADDGKTPGRRRFEQETGIRESDWLGKIWARWSDAIADAGLQPNTKQGRADGQYLIESLYAACVHYGRMPTVAEYELYRKRETDFPAYKTLQSHFGRKENIVWELRHWLLKNHSRSELLATLPKGSRISTQPERTKKAISSDGYVYLLKSGPHYKIGRSDDLEKRVKQISVALPESVSLEHAIRTDDPVGIARYWHKRFADFRANGEWFRLGSDELRAFKKRRYQ